MNPPDSSTFSKTILSNAFALLEYLGMCYCSFTTGYIQISPQQITWHQEVTYVSIVSMNTLGFRCKMQNEVSVREYMDILVKHYDVIPYNRTISSWCILHLGDRHSWSYLGPGKGVMGPHVPRAFPCVLTLLACLLADWFSSVSGGPKLWDLHYSHTPGKEYGALKIPRAFQGLFLTVFLENQYDHI